MPQIEPIPILLLTGFLGSGKTTMLARWLKAPEFEGAMVIVNELGEVGLDHRLLTTSTDVPLLLENGCACCAAQEDLVGTLERLFWDRLHKRIPRFSWVLIETTGIADPAPILDALRRHVLLSERYRIAGVVTALDAKRGLAAVERFPECRSQVVAASLVILTKTDLASADEMAAARAGVEVLATGVHILESAAGALPAGALLAALAACPDCGSHAHGPGHHHHHDHDHHHHDDARHGRVVAEHADGVTSAFLPLPQPQSWTALIHALDTLMVAHGRSLLRLKGIVRLEGAPGFHAVQATPGQGITREELPITEEQEPPRTGFTMIASQEPAAGIASSLKALIAIRTARPVADPAPVRGGAADDR